jgi:DNA polymerase-3 subunit delta
MQGLPRKLGVSIAVVVKRVVQQAACAMLYLFYGSDEYARSEALARMRATIPADVADLNITVIDGKRLKLEPLVGACEAAPFLADRRLVIVQDGLKHTRAGKERDALRAYLERVPEWCDLVFVEREDVDKRSTLFTYLKKAGNLQEFVPLQGPPLLRWIDATARDLDVQLAAGAAQHLVDLVGNESRLLVNELQKLANYAGRGGRVDSAVIDRLVADRQEQNLFTFIDDLSRRRTGAALRAVRLLIEEGQAPTYIMFMLARQARILLGVKQFQAQRMSADNIASALGQRPFVVRKALEQVRAFEPGELEAFHDRLLELDLAIKTGKIQADAALELIVAETCLASRQG